jgi:hypothetical protein
MTILKVLDGQPTGRAILPELKRYVAILLTSGPDWTERMRQLSAFAPQLDIFGQSLVRRDRDGWAITEGGKAFLVAIERAIHVDRLTK